MWSFKAFITGFIFWLILSSAQAQPEILLAAVDDYDSGKYDNVIERLEKLETGHHSFNSMMLLADAQQKKGNYKAAIDAYNIAFQYNTNSAKLYTHRGSAYLWSGKYDAAAADLDKALTIDQNNYRTWYYLGVNAYYRLKIRSAIKALDRCIELNDDYAPAWYMRGACHGERSQTTPAIHDYSEALARDTSLVEARFNIAVLKFENKDYLEAGEEFTTLLSALPDKKAEILYYRAESAYFSNDKQQACNDYYEAMQLGDELSGDIYDKYCLKNENRKDLPSRKTESISL